MDGLKRPTSYEEQLEILKSRGAFISDKVFCLQKMAEINYYRFSAYFLPFRKSDGTYMDDTSFHTVYRIYEFDRKLRGILFSAIEEIEIYLRAKIAYFHAHKYGPLGYMDVSNFSGELRKEKVYENIEREIRSNSQTLFVKHHIEKYNGQFPVWVIIELFTLGMLSRFYSDMLVPDKKQLARELYGTTSKNLASWLRCITDFRNVCAHYGRLYYRVFPAIPSGISLPASVKRRLWGMMLVLKLLYPNGSKWNSEVLTSLESLFDEYRGYIDLYHIAFSPDWNLQLKK